jgi:hypothetical protein
MHVWHDTLSAAPEADDMILFRRYPNDTPPLYGRWDPPSGGVYCGLAESHWIPFDLCTRWTYTDFIPAYPAVQAVTGYRCPYYWPPSDQQSCWVRRYLGDTSAFRATWHADLKRFTASIREEYAVDIEWYYVWRWKPL